MQLEDVILHTQSIVQFHQTICLHFLRYIVFEDDVSRKVGFGANSNLRNRKNNFPHSAT